VRLVSKLLLQMPKDILITQCDGKSYPQPAKATEEAIAKDSVKDDLFVTYNCNTLRY